MKVTTKQWTEALVTACEGKGAKAVETTAGEFVRLLAKRGELGRVRDVIRRLTVTVVAETAHPLKAATRKAIEEIAQGPVTEVVRPELIGGLRLRVDDRVYDGTIAGQLENLHKKLVE